jgi:hypothetical protein
LASRCTVKRIVGFFVFMRIPINLNCYVSGLSIGTPVTEIPIIFSFPPVLLLLPSLIRSFKYDHQIRTDFETNNARFRPE